MNIKLEPFQKKIVDELTDSLSRAALNSLREEKFCYLLSAPTGSGKTIMAGSAIKRLIDSDSDIRVVWLTIATGDIASQSNDTLLKKLNFDADSLHLFDTLAPFSESVKVIFASWTYLKSTRGDAKLKNFNSPMKEGGISFSETIKLWIKSEKKVFLFIDEFHHTAASALSKEIIDEMAIPIVVEMSATPLNNKNRLITYTRSFVPNSEEVRLSGIVKSGLDINNFLSEQNVEIVDQVQYLLSVAKGKLDAIKAEYLKYGNEINPLALIQCQNSDRTTIISKLNELGLDSDEVAQHFSDKKENIEDIQNHNSRVRFLLCNQAIATGWDCPRAHVLVQLIKVGAENFQIQVIGRILRTAIRRLFDNDILDNGYVYTYFDQNIDLINECKKLNEPSAIRLRISPEPTRLTLFNSALTKAQLNNRSVKSVQLKSVLKDMATVSSHQIMFEDLANASNIVALSKITPNYTKLVSGRKHDLINNEFTDGEIATLATSEDYYCKEMLDKHGLSRIVFDAVVMPYIKKNLSIDKGEKIPEKLFEVAAQYEQSNTKTSLITGPIFQIRSEYTVPIGDESWIFNKTILTNNLEFNGHFVQRLSGPELNFIRGFLEIDKEIVYWFKNFDSGSYCFSTAFRYVSSSGSEEFHIHNPDFICLDSFGRIRIYEIKELTESELADSFTRAKLKGMAKEVIASRASYEYSLIFVESAVKSKVEANTKSQKIKMIKLDVDESQVSLEAKL
jgi:superfamily II DNA or RNA helicase